MAKKPNTKGDAPQQNTGAAAAEQPKAAAQNPDQIAGTAADGDTGTVPVVIDRPGAGLQADENTAGASAGAAGETKHPNPARATNDNAEVAVTTTTKKAVGPKVSDAVIKIGKGLLKNNPEISVVYMTADGRGFYEKNDAELHATTLNNEAVIPVNK